MRPDRHEVCDNAKDPADRYCDEPTLAEVLSDPLTLAVMAADHIDRHDLTATLTRIAGEIAAWRGLAVKQNRSAVGAIAKAGETEPTPDVTTKSPNSTRGWDPRMVRNKVRLYSGLVLLAFVVCHLTAHGFLLISFEWAGAALDALMFPWRTAVGTTVLAAALLAHYANALWSIYLRRTLRLPMWEAWQLGLGLCIPLLLMLHVTSTRIAESLLNVSGDHHSSVLIVQWVLSPWLAILQTAAVLTVWLHASIGIHSWLRTKPWYGRWRPLFVGAALLLPTAALAGYIAAGNQVLRVAQNPNYAASSLDRVGLTQQKRAEIARIARIGSIAYLAVVALPFVGRGVRGGLQRRRKPPLLTHSNGQTVPISSGATVLETLRANGIPHASVCGGRARCTTCRILVTKGLDTLPSPSALEARALTRIGARPGMRLACQTCPTADISVMPLLAADASAADGMVRGGLEGSERLVTVLFVDLHDSTALSEAKLPYDLLYILNQFFAEMIKALEASNGHYAQFAGDGLMALYGLNGKDPATGVADALRGSREMLARIDRLNSRLRGDLPRPLRIGIGIHFSEAIVGTMGPPGSQVISAIGETVNVCARLESLTKAYDCAVVVSRRAAEMAGLDVKGRRLHQATAKGRTQTVEFYALKTLADLRV